MKKAVVWHVAQAVCLGWMSMSSGCSDAEGPLIVPVKGVVHYNGKPLPQAGVTFTSPAGRPAIGQTNDSGEFTLTSVTEGDGATVGSHVVTVSKFDKPAAEDAGRDGAPSSKPPKTLIPIKYADPSRTPFKAEVKADADNEFSFDLAD